MKSETQDKQYLALELTKIAYSNLKQITDTNILTTYEYYLKNLTGIIDEVDTVDALKSEIERLRKENARLKENNLDSLKPLINDIVTIVNGCKGDMEQYVYEAIISNCRRYER